LRAGARGPWIAPTFLGVSAPAALPAEVQLLLHLHGQPPSYLDAFYRELHRALLRRVSAEAIVRLPGVGAGAGLVLSTPLAVIPTARWPTRSTQVDHEAFFTFHDWLAAEGLPSGVVLAQPLTGGDEGQWLDLAHPDGLANLLRLGAGATHVALSEPWLPERGEGLRTPRGTYRVELYLEIDAGSS
jgi:hypothetical protein